MSTKEYLGDAVYAELENGMIKLTTDDGCVVTNVIYLEQEVYSALVKYIDRQKYG